MASFFNSPLLKSQFTRRRVAVLSGIIGVGIAAVLALVSAAVQVVSTEAESGTNSGGIATVNDSSASGGKAIRFGQTTGPGNPTMSLTLNAATKYQTIDGFGVNIASDSWDNGNLRPVLDSLIDQNGSQIFRVVMEMQDWEQANDNSDPNTYNWTYYDPIYAGTTSYDTAQSGSNFGNLWNVIDYLHQKGIPDNQIILSNMGPGPAWNGGKTVSTQTQINEWVEAVTSEAYWGYSHGHTFGLFSPNNEMDFTNNEGITMSAANYTNGLAQVAQRLDSLGMSSVRFIAPDTADAGSPFQTYANAIKGNATVMAKVAHFGLHDYSGSTGTANAVVSGTGKNFWMDEFSVFTQAFSMLEQNASALLMWDAYDAVYNHAILNGLGSSPGNDAGNAPALIAYNANTKVYTPRLSFYQFGQLFRYTPPGMQRVDVVASNGNFDLVAFVHPTTGAITIVGNNTGTTNEVIGGTLTNAPAASTFHFSMTNSTKNMAAGADVPIANNSFTVAVPAKTVFTLTTL